MKIGIVTFVKCDNYGAELQAFAIQHVYNKLGYDAEVIDLEKQNKDLAKSINTIIPAIINRVKYYKIKAPIKIIELILDVISRKKAAKKYEKEISLKHKLFFDFFNEKIKHSQKHYSLTSIFTEYLPYDVYIAGSDQIWNYMHTDFLDVYFLKFANKWNAKKISYAASISVPDIPEKLRLKYKNLFENMDVISVRELNGKSLVEKYSNKKATVVLDPTLLITKDEWKEYVANEIRTNEKYVLIYTLSGSKYIYELALNIASRIDKQCKVINIKSNFIPEKDDKIEHLYQVGPKEWVGLMLNAAYVVTDSFHGTAFSINFNIPFSTLLNPSSNMNSRVLSILEITNLKDRIIYDDGSKAIPQNLNIDYQEVNKTINKWRKKSEDFITTSINN